MSAARAERAAAEERVAELHAKVRAGSDDTAKAQQAQRDAASRAIKAEATVGRPRHQPHVRPVCVDFERRELCSTRHPLTIRHACDEHTLDPVVLLNNIC